MENLREDLFDAPGAELASKYTRWLDRARAFSLIFYLQDIMEHCRWRYFWKSRLETDFIRFLLLFSLTFSL